VHAPASRGEVTSGGGTEVVDRFFFAVAADQMSAGLERYWRKRVEKKRNPSA